MRNILLLLAGLPLVSACQAGTFKIDFAMEKNEYLLGEPMTVTIDLENVSDREQNILFSKSLYANTLQLVIKDTRQNEIAKELYPDLDHFGGDAVLKKTVDRDMRISLTLDATKYYALNKTGEYSISARYKCDGNEGTWKGEVQSAEKVFTIKEPVSDDDKNALKLLTRPSAFGPEFIYSEDTCEALLMTFPNSQYVKYARFYLAESDRRWMETGARTYVKKAFDEAMELYTKAVDDKFTFSDEAQLGIAKCWVIKGDIEMAAKDAQKVIDNFPKSNSVEDAKQLLKGIEEQRIKKSTETLKKK